MNKIKKLILSCLLLSLFALPSCGSSSGGNTAPNQADVNLAVQDFVGDLLDLVVFLDFFGINNCNDLDNLIQALVGTEACDDGGSTTISVSNFTCSDGPPITAAFTISQNDDNCSELGDVANGTIDASVSFDGSVVIFNISSSGIAVDDLVFQFSNFVVTFNSSLTASCTGGATVNGQTCTVNADCTACNLN